MPNTVKGISLLAATQVEFVGKKSMSLTKPCCLLLMPTTLCPVSQQDISNKYRPTNYVVLHRELDNSPITIMQQRFVDSLECCWW